MGRGRGSGMRHDDEPSRREGLRRTDRGASGRLLQRTTVDWPHGDQLAHCRTSWGSTPGN